MSDFSLRTALARANDLLPAVLQQGVSPKEALYKYARENKLSPGKFNILAQAFNTVRANYHFKHASDRTAPFEVVDAKELEREYASEVPETLKAQKAQDGPASKTEQEAASSAGRKLLRLYRRRHGLDQDTGEDKRSEGDKKSTPLPSFEEWSKGFAERHKLADFHEDTFTEDSAWTSGFSRKAASIEAPAAPEQDEVRNASEQVKMARELIRDTDRLLASIGTRFRKKADADTAAFAETEKTIRGGKRIQATEQEIDELAKTASFTLRRSSSFIKRDVDSTRGLTDVAIELIEARRLMKEARQCLADAETAEQESFAKVANTPDWKAFVTKLAALSAPGTSNGRGLGQQGRPASQPYTGSGQASPRPTSARMPSTTGTAATGDVVVPRREEPNAYVPKKEDDGGLPALPAYESQVPEVFGKDYLSGLLGQLTTGDRKGQRYYDETVRRLEVQKMLQTMLTKDTVIAAHFDADPQHVADLAADILNTAPNLASNPSVLRFTLRETLAHGAMPLSTATALTKGEKEMADTAKIKETLNEGKYKGKGSMAELLTT